MDLIQWTDKLSVGVESLDNDHKRLIDLINKLAETTQAGEDRAVVGDVLTELVDYTHYHFAREEKIQEAGGYPDLERHKDIHADLTEQVEEVKADFEASDATGVGRDVLLFLSDWLRKHIMGEDMKYVAYVKDVNIDA